MGVNQINYSVSFAEYDGINGEQLSTSFELEIIECPDSLTTNDFDFSAWTTTIDLLTDGPDTIPMPTLSADIDPFCFSGDLVWNWMLVNSGAFFNDISTSFTEAEFSIWRQRDDFGHRNVLNNDGNPWT